MMKLFYERWRRPVMSIWGGNQSEVQKAVDWARYQFENPDDQDDIVQALRCLNRYSLTNDDNLKGMASDLTEEVFMIDYTHPREDESIIFLTEDKNPLQLENLLDHGLMTHLFTLVETLNIDN